MLAIRNHPYPVPTHDPFDHIASLSSHQHGPAHLEVREAAFALQLAQISVRIAIASDGLSFGGLAIRLARKGAIGARPTIQPLRPCAAQHDVLVQHAHPAVSGASADRHVAFARPRGRHDAQRDAGEMLGWLAKVMHDTAKSLRTTEVRHVGRAFRTARQAADAEVGATIGTPRGLDRCAARRRHIRDRPMNFESLATTGGMQRAQPTICGPVAGNDAGLTARGGTWQCAIGHMYIAVMTFGPRTTRHHLPRNIANAGKPDTAAPWHRTARRGAREMPAQPGVRHFCRRLPERGKHAGQRGRTAVSTM